jgi:hypothetical protein
MAVNAQLKHLFCLVIWRQLADTNNNIHLSRLRNSLADRRAIPHVFGHIP